MFSGRTQREKDRFAEAVTNNTVMVLGVERKDVIIVSQEEPHGNWYACLNLWVVESKEPPLLLVIYRKGLYNRFFSAL